MNRLKTIALWVPAAILAASSAKADLQPNVLPGDYSSPDGLWLLDNGLVAFRAYSTATGSELWVSDGTALGTRVVDLVAGTFGSAPIELRAFAGGHLVTAKSPDGGYEPWFTDLNSNHRPLADLRAGADSSLPRYIESTSTHAFLEAETSAGVREWFYLPAATLVPAPVSNLNPALAGQPLRNFRAAGELFYFTSGAGNQFWRTDGTPSGTYAIDPTPYTGTIGNRIAFDDQLFFTVGTSLTSGRLWRTDGTVAGTQRITPEGNLDVVDYMSVAGNRLIFRNTGWNSSGLWVSDGTDAGTYRLEDQDGLAFNVYPSRTAGNDDGFFFRDNDTIWRSDGTGLNTYSVFRHTNSGVYAGGSFSGATLTDNGIYFYAYEGRAGSNYTWEVWSSDGTPEGTYRLYLHEAPTIGFTAYAPVAEGNRVFFIAPSANGHSVFTLDLDAPRAAGDFNGNARHTSADVDLLWKRIRAGSADTTYDIDGNGAINAADVTAWISTFGKTFAADITLDGDVDQRDLLTVSSNYTGSRTTGAQRPWTLGNFDGDDDTDFDDVVTLRLYLGAGDNGEWFGSPSPDRYGPLPDDGSAAELIVQYDAETGRLSLVGQTLRDLVALEIVGQDGNFIPGSELRSALPLSIDNAANSLVRVAVDGQLIDGMLELGAWTGLDLAALENLSVRYALEGDAMARTAPVHVPEPAAALLLAPSCLLALRRRRR